MALKYYVEGASCFAEDDELYACEFVYCIRSMVQSRVVPLHLMKCHSKSFSLLAFLGHAIEMCCKSSASDMAVVLSVIEQAQLAISKMNTIWKSSHLGQKDQDNVLSAVSNFF